MARSSPTGRAVAGLAISALTVFSLVACSGGSSSKAASSTTTGPTQTSGPDSTTSTSTSTSTSGSGDTTQTSLAGAGVSPVSTPVAGRALLTAVRAAQNSGFDRVVFEFESGAPGYSVKYVERPIVQDGSGAEVKIAGEGVLEVRMEHASGVDLAGSRFRETYKGPTRIPVDGRAIVELTQGGDFEGVLRWDIGVNGKLPFTVHVLTGPSRIVIDIQHPPATR